MIYLASPYSHSNISVRYKRYECVLQVAARLIKEGQLVFCPVVHTHPINIILGSEYWDFSRWKEFDLAMLDKCDELVIVRIPGWETSKGVTEETRYARQWDIPIRFVDPTPEELEVLK